MRRDKVIEFLLDEGADVVAKDDKGKTPLHIAFSEGIPKVIAPLTKKIDVHDRDNYGNTPLHQAVKGGSVDFVEILINRGLM